MAGNSPYKPISYQDILADPSKGYSTINSPYNSKDNAEWRDSQSKVGNSSKKGHFNVRLSSTFEPSEKFIYSLGKFIYQQTCKSQII